MRDLDARSAPGGAEPPLEALPAFLPQVIVLLPAAVALVVYAAGVAPGAHWSDTADLQRAAILLDTPHPTGYPLYLLLGKLWSILIAWGNPAWRLNLLSAVLSAGTVATAGLAALRLTARPVAGLAAGAFLAVTAGFWSQALVAEVYALHTLIVAAILVAALSPRVRLTAISFLLGLGLAHHRMIVLLLPGLAACLWLRRGALHVRPRTLACSATALAAGPLLYVVTWRGADWGGITPFLRYVLATGHGNWSTDDMASHMATFVLPILTQQLHVVGLALAAIGLVWTVRCGRPTPTAAAALLGLGWLCALGFLLVYRVGDLYAFAGHLHVFQAVAAAAGVVAVLDAVTGAVSAFRRSGPSDGRPSRTPGLSRLLILALLAAAVGWQALRTHRAVVLSDDAWRWPAQEATAALAEVESGGTLVTGYVIGETCRYLTEVDRVRPDVTVAILEGADAGRADGLLAAGAPVYLWGKEWSEAFADRPERLVDIGAAGGPADLFRLVDPEAFAGLVWGRLGAALQTDARVEGSGAGSAEVHVRPFPLVADAPAEMRWCSSAATLPVGWLLEIDAERGWFRTVTEAARATTHATSDGASCARSVFVVPPAPYGSELPLRLSALAEGGAATATLSVSVRVHAAGERLRPERMSHHPVRGPQVEGRSRPVGVDHPSAARPGMQVPITAYWWVEPGDGARNDAGRATLLVDWQLSGDKAGQRASSARVNVLQEFGAQGWQAPALVAGPLALGIPPRADPGVYTLSVATPRERLPRVVSTLTVEPWPRLDRVPSGLQPTEALWDGGSVRLAAFEAMPARDAVTVTLAWQSTRETDHDWKVFVHLVGPTGDLVSQHDAVPAEGLRRTDGWRQGEVVLDAHRVPLPGDLPEGRYAVRVGLYDERTLQRAPLENGDAGTASADALILTTIALPAASTP